MEQVMTVRELIARLQEDDIPQDATVNFRAYAYSEGRIEDFKVHDITDLYIDYGPNAHSRVMLLSEDV
jgi:hypothetical protein